MSVWTWLGVGTLGGVGALARFALQHFVDGRSGRAFPLGTLAVNLTGTAALGVLAGLALSGNALVLLGGGVLGSYTTFSTWMLESQRLGEGGRARAAVVNVALSLAAGLGAVALGRLLAGA